MEALKYEVLSPGSNAFQSFSGVRTGHMVSMKIIGIVEDRPQYFSFRESHEGLISKFPFKWLQHCALVVESKFVTVGPLPIDDNPN